MTGQDFRALRERAGLSLSQMAEKLGLRSKSAIYRKEHNQRPVTARDLKFLYHEGLISKREWWQEGV